MEVVLKNTAIVNNVLRSWNIISYELFHVFLTMLHFQAPTTINSHTAKHFSLPQNCNFIYFNACLPHQQHQFSNLLPLLTVACEVYFNYFIHFCIIFHLLFCCCMKKKIQKNGKYKKYVVHVVHQHKRQENLLSGHLLVFFV